MPCPIGAGLTLSAATHVLLRSYVTTLASGAVLASSVHENYTGQVHLRHQSTVVGLTTQAIVDVRQSIRQLGHQAYPGQMLPFYREKQHIHVAG